MMKGLPLASADVQAGQAGLLLSGQIFQAFGNYQGLTQTLDFVVVSDGGATQSEPANLVFQCPAGQPISGSLKSALQAAYPNLSVNVNVSPNLVLSQPEAGVYQTIQQFAGYLNGLTAGTQGADYQGVQMTLANGVLNVFDGTVAGSVAPAKQILQQDLIGQVTWLDANQIQFNTVLRADLSVGQTVVLPQLAGLQVVSSAASQTNARNNNAFSGSWTLSYMRHVGNSRDPYAQSWITNFQAYSNSASPAALGVANSSS